MRTFAPCKAFFFCPSVWGGIKRFEHFERGLYFSDNCAFEFVWWFCVQCFVFFRRAELKPSCILSLVVTVTFLHSQRWFIYICRTTFIFVFSQRTVMLTHAREHTCALKTFSELMIEGKQAYSRTLYYFDHFSVAQVIIVRVFSCFHF